MSAHSGLLYYFDLLGLDRDTLRVHYRFDVNSGATIPNDAPNFPQMSGQLSSVGGFYDSSGSGKFTGQNVQIQNATGIPADFWTHIFVYEKTGAGRGVLFDSLMTGSIYSGYVIGVNDNNRLYFESYDQKGPFSKTSDIILGKKNVVAVVRANSLLTFYCYDFNNSDILSDSHSLNGTYVLSAAKGVIGATNNAPNFIERNPFTGYLDEYLYLQEGVTPSTFRYLVSGLCSDYSVTSGAVICHSSVEITGYTTIVTGVSGVTGYEMQVTGSGLDPFGTGSYELYWGVVPKMGYLVSGLQVVNLSGVVVRCNTGDPQTTLTLRGDYTKGFNLDEVSYVRKMYESDFSVLNVFSIFGPTLNLEAGYDFVLGQFQLGDLYQENQVGIYLNGISQLSTGYSVTGGFYQSGVVLSGDYRLDGFYMDSTGFFNETDVVIYDELSGAKSRAFITGAQPGLYEDMTVSGQLIFLNGQLLVSGYDYSAGTGSQFRWENANLQGATGALTSFPMGGCAFSYYTGILLTTTNVPRRNSQLFLNGQRQRLGQDYIENSSIDLIRQSGIFENSLPTVYDNNDLFFEDWSDDPDELAIPTADFDIYTADTTYWTADVT